MIFYNTCAFSVNQAGPYFLLGIRKGIVAQPFAFWLVFVLIKLILFKGKRGIGYYQSKNSQANYYTDSFHHAFGMHIVSICFVLLHYPFPFALSMVWIHFGFSFFYLFANIDNKFPRIRNGLFAAMQLINLILLLTSMIGMGFQLPVKYQPLICKYQLN